jgi:hypothetical protein
MGRTQMIIRLVLVAGLLVLVYYNLLNGGQGPR